jgi:2-dehydro-3-deoxygluconokinase
VLYDRADSAFARIGGGTHDWPALLAGADWLHVSGVTPALGQRAADGVLTAVRAARAAGTKVSFDGNFRPKLWEAWGGDAPTILRGLMAEADLLFASHRDLQVVLGLEFPQATPQERFAAGAAAAFQAFPHLHQMAATVRVQRSVDHHVISAITALRDGALHTTAARDVSPIVDRIGTGDAFAAGVLHGGLAGLSAQAALEFGVAAACLKHSLPGDFNLVGAADVHALLGENALDVKR